MTDREKELQDFHNQGQEDGADNEYHTPHGDGAMFLTGLTGSDEALNELREDNEAYRTGNDNGHESTSSCYLTTACVDFKGLGDNCEELSVMRRFRDDYVAKLPNGNELISEYYQTAPAIVSRIKASSDKAQVLSGIYVKLRTIVELVKAGNNIKAANKYSEMYKGLKTRFFCSTAESV